MIPSNTIVGACAGFALGFLGSISLGLFRLHLEGYPTLVCGVLGAAVGAWVGHHGGPLARWCAGMAATVGGVAFAWGFVGPIVLQPDSPQGPLLGIFFTGPLGAIVGAVLGLAIGAAREGRHGAVPERGGRSVG